jgi:hypothetical protein
LGFPEGGTRWVSAYSFWQLCWQSLVLAMGPGFHPKNGSVRTQTRRKTRPAHSLRAKPGPIPINPQRLPEFARLVGCNLRLCVLGFTLIVAFRYTTFSRKVLTLVHDSSFSMYWPPWWSKPIETCTRSHSENDRQRSVNGV